MKSGRVSGGPEHDFIGDVCSKATQTAPSKSISPAPKKVWLSSYLSIDGKTPWVASIEVSAFVRSNVIIFFPRGPVYPISTVFPTYDTSV